MNHLLHGTDEMYSNNDDYVYLVLCEWCDEKRENHLVKKGIWKDPTGEEWDGDCCEDCQQENTEVTNEQIIERL
ncbi:MAG: hypothetical protein QQN63_02870 [Nitrosopumilus sp.]